MKTKAYITFILTGLISISFQIVTSQNSDPAITKDRVMESGQVLKSDFLKLQFGMFIHYNMATYKNVQWVEGYPDPSEFSPGVETINTDAWADAAVSAGMKYAVLIAPLPAYCN
mgnify:CR=1 FL=1